MGDGTGPVALAGVRCRAVHRAHGSLCAAVSRFDALFAQVGVWGPWFSTQSGTLEFPGSGFKNIDSWWYPSPAARVADRPGVPRVEGWAGRARGACEKRLGGLAACATHYVGTQRTTGTGELVNRCLPDEGSRDPLSCWRRDDTGATLVVQKLML